MTGDHVSVISYRIELDTPADHYHRFIEYPFSNCHLSPDSKMDSTCIKTTQRFSKKNYVLFRQMNQNGSAGELKRSHNEHVLAFISIREHPVTGKGGYVTKNYPFFSATISFTPTSFQTDDRSLRMITSGSSWDEWPNAVSTREER